MLSFTKTGPANSLPGPAEDGGERDPVFTAEEKAGIDPAGEVASDLEAQTGGAAIDPGIGEALVHCGGICGGRGVCNGELLQVAGDVDRFIAVAVAHCVLEQVADDDGEEIFVGVEDEGGGHLVDYPDGIVIQLFLQQADFFLQDIAETDRLKVRRKMGHLAFAPEQEVFHRFENIFRGFC